jgi:hypothetical protein
LARGPKQADSNCQVIATALLGQIRWSEVHGNTLGGKLELTVYQGRADAVLALTHRNLGQTNNRYAGQTTTQVNLNRYARSVQACLGPAKCRRQPHTPSMA